MTDKQCARCGEVNPAEIHTCTPKESHQHGGRIMTMREIMEAEGCEPFPPQREEGCAECGKKSSDGWALYCVKCIEPPRTWTGLTDEEMREIWDKSGWYVTLFKAVEAKLKEKNSA